MTHTLLVYGTLRPRLKTPFSIPGTMYDLGAYPGVILGTSSLVLVEPVEVQTFEHLDRYEGYDEHYPEDSL